MNTDSMPQRLLSLDVFRGFTIAAMVLVNNPSDWAHIYAPLRHATWNGWTFTDWIFPFFLFICGVSLTFSTTRVLAVGVPKRTIMLQLWRRAAIIILIGLTLNFIPGLALKPCATQACCSGSVCALSSQRRLCCGVICVGRLYGLSA